MNNPRPKAHQQVMVAPTKSTMQRVAVTPPGPKPTSGSKGGSGAVPGAKVNSPGIKGVKGC